MPILAWIWYLAVGVALGAIALHVAMTFTRQGQRQEHQQQQPRDRFERVRSSMPELLGEMAPDVMENPKVRWCVPLDSKSTTCNVSRDHFSYYASDHRDLFAKFEILEINGYLQDVTPGNRWEPGTRRIYAMTEEFVQRLRTAI